MSAISSLGHYCYCAQTLTSDEQMVVVELGVYCHYHFLATCFQTFCLSISNLQMQQLHCHEPSRSLTSLQAQTPEEL
jgi:hypothetical protein